MLELEELRLRLQAMKPQIDDLSDALGLEAKENAFDSVRQLAAFGSLQIPASLGKLETAPTLHTLTCDRGAMGEAVMKAYEA